MKRCFSTPSNGGNTYTAYSSDSCRPNGQIGNINIKVNRQPGDKPRFDDNLKLLRKNCASSILSKVKMRKTYCIR